MSFNILYAYFISMYSYISRMSTDEADVAEEGLLHVWRQVFGTPVLFHNEGVYVP